MLSRGQTDHNEDDVIKGMGYTKYVLCFYYSTPVF